jgi:protein-tyrosine-phosphatase
MAEGFARAYGGDVMEALSAGVAPYSHVPVGTRETMAEKGIDLSKHFPKHVSEMADENIDLVINLSGSPLPFSVRHMRDWPVRDPFGDGEAAYRAARDQIEQRVMDLVLEVRQLKEDWQGLGGGKAR